MDNYILFLTVIGLAAFAMAWMPALTKATGISYSILYVIAGVALYYFLGDYLPAPIPDNNIEITLHLTELIVIISLMGTGIKIDRPFSFKNWASPLKLISVTMVLSIAIASLIGYYYLHFDLASCLLLGAALAPTDPVLASDVQVGPPNSKTEPESKFALTAEAGLNDGMAFPFTSLAVLIATIPSGTNPSIVSWVTYDFLYKILAGIAVGYAIGKLAGHVVFGLSKKLPFLKTNEGFVAISLTLLVYGITELIHGYGFIAVFVCAIILRHYEKGHHYHDQLHTFTDQIERLLIAVILILFGGALAYGILDFLSWQMVLFSLIFLFIVRPITAYIVLHKANFHWKEKFAISFFGIRGMGSIFYLAWAFNETIFKNQKELWSVVAFTILVSLIIHGLTATPIMKHLKENIPQKKS